MAMWNGETVDTAAIIARRARANQIDEGLQKFREARAEDAANLEPRSKREALLDLHTELTAKAFATMEIKNNAYATTDDPFRNLRGFGLLGVLVRLSDKLSRLQVFVENGFDGVADESVDDTVRDGINYLVLFEGLRKELSSNNV